MGCPRRKRGCARQPIRHPFFPLRRAVTYAGCTAPKRHFPGQDRPLTTSGIQAPIFGLAAQFAQPQRNLLTYILSKLPTMPLPFSLPQASLAATIITSTVGTYIALSPPNPASQSAPLTGDSIRLFTHKHTTKIAVAPLGLLALHASSLAYLYPAVPTALLRYGAENGLNPNLITWSTATAVPLVLIICAGIPLRLASYALLGKNFTFTLAEPDRLTRTGLYRYVQHPSYTGLLILIVCNVALLCRTDGVLSCWAPPVWYPLLRMTEWVLAPVGLVGVLFAVWTRVREEERMLRAEFGLEWEIWHACTARFIPWLF